METPVRLGRAAGTRIGVSAMLATLLVFAFLLPSPAARADDMRNAEYWLDSLGITAAQEETQGEGVKVAIIDTGIDTSHRDLLGAVVGGADMSGAGGAKGDKPIGVMSEHGTLVATLLAGRGNNQGEIDRVKSENQRLKSAWEQAKKTAEEEEEDVPEEPEYEKVPELTGGQDGVLGVAPKAQLLSISLWMGDGNPAGISVEQQIPKAVRYAVDSGAKVINMSLGSTSPAWPQSWDEAFKYAEEHDVVIVAAAGNRSGGMSQVGAPATIPGVLTVAGVDENDKASQDSSTEGISIGVAAPAEKLVGGLPEDGYARWSGTSGAAPLVAGVAALIRSKYPDMPAAQVINRILTTAKDTGAAGVDNLYGYGIIDANAAVRAEVPAVSENPLGTITEWIRVHRRNTESTTDTPDPGVSTETSDLEQVAAPAPIAPDTSTPPLQPALVVGGAALLALVLVIGGVQVGSRARKQALSARVASAKLSELRVGKTAEGRDLFDDIPEDEK
ncbi:S8 family serine peptidase [Glutamicibacter sp. NPDC087344]|uniref:S8 family serine peptidase n=1 Tax=Glutamicibacter sp. NPDC087344 TaxID=3363994 RepID=UPI0038176A72